MADFAKILATLKDEERQLANRAAQVRAAIDALSSGEASGGRGRKKARKKTAKKKTGRRAMSASARKAIGKRMKKYWADRKKQASKKKAAKD